MSRDLSIETLIKLVNRLQDCFSSLGVDCPIDLPQIAVLGEQSSGKSSVLENFVGKDFLPRGAGIVTRCPLVLQMVNQEGDEYAQFLHIRDKKFFDFLEVRKEIEDRTETMTGGDKNITSTPINLRVFSPKVLNLTLVDLPGLTKVAVGKQAANTHEQIREMVFNYVAKPNCLILAVTPAVIDLANSESLQMARQVDPKGLRTIGVITKIDLMDAGTDCRDVLENKVYPLRRGFIGVVNRSQKDIIGNKDIAAAQLAEKEFFSSHPVYSQLADRMGTGFLQKHLNIQLSEHIKKLLPSLKTTIKERLEIFEMENKDILAEKELTPKSMLTTFLRIISDMVDLFQEEFGLDYLHVRTDRLASSHKIFNHLFSEFPNMLINARPSEEQAISQINIAIQNTKGAKGSIYQSDMPFLTIAREYIIATKQSCVEACDKTFTSVSYFISFFAEKLKNFPLLHERVVAFIQAGLEKNKKKAIKFISDYLDFEANHINMNHPDMIEQVNILSGSDKFMAQRQQLKAQISQVNHRGYLKIVMDDESLSKNNFYFILKNNLMVCYDDERCFEEILRIVVDECVVLVRKENASYGQENVFTLKYEDNKNIYMEMKEMSFRCENNTSFASWIRGFRLLGLKIQQRSKDATKAKEGTVVPLENITPEVEDMLILLNTYLTIVNKNQLNFIPKVCVYYLVHKTKKLILPGVVAHFIAENDLFKLMQEDQEVALSKKKVFEMHKSLKEAFSILQDNINDMRKMTFLRHRPTLHLSADQGLPY